MLKRKGSVEPSKAKATKDEDGFVARRSTHVTGEKFSKSDGDTWQETLAVCEMDGKLITRSYFSNIRTQQRQWDEPPSGASKVEHASDTMQKMAQIQLQEMQIATGNVPDSDATPQAKASSKKSGFGFFRRSNSKTEGGNDSSATDNGGGKKKIQYRSDSFLAKTKRDSKKSEQKYDEQLDLSMQKALASSMSSSKGGGGSSDDLERALAMSLTESSSHRRSRSKSRDTSSPDTTLVRGGLRSQSPSMRGRSSQRSSSQPRSASKDDDGTGKRSPHKRLPPTGPPRSQSTDGAAPTPHHHHHGEGSSHHRSHPPPGEGSSHRRNHIPPHAGEGASHHRSHGEGSSHRRSHIPVEAAAPKVSERKSDPSSTQEDNKDFDASIVRFEFSHDEEEEMALAMSLSLIEFDMNDLKEKDNKSAAAAAKMPTTEEDDLTSMTEEEQLSIALSQSMAIAAPERKSDKLLRSGKTKTSENEDDNQKMPAAREFVARNNPGIHHDDTAKLNTVTEKSAASTQKRVVSEGLPGTTYVTSLNDRAANKPCRHPRMLRRLSGSHLGNSSTAPSSRSGSYQGNGTRSLSPVPKADRSSLKSPDAMHEASQGRSRSPKSPDPMRQSSHSHRSHSRKSPDPMRHSSHSRCSHSPKSPDPMRHSHHSCSSRSPKSPDPMRFSSHSRSSRSPKSPDPMRLSSHSRSSHSTKSPDPMRHSSHSRTLSPKISPTGDHSMMRHSSRGPRSSPKGSPGSDSIVRHTSRGKRSRSPRPGGDSLRHSSHGPKALSLTRASANDSLRHTDSSSMGQRDALRKHGPTVPDLAAGPKQVGDHTHHRGHQAPSNQDAGASRRGLTKEEAATREEKMLQKAMKASLRDICVGNSAAKPNATEPSRGAKPPGISHHHKPHHGQVPARRKLTVEEISAREAKMLQKAMRASLKEQDLIPTEAKEQAPTTAAPKVVEKSSGEHHHSSHRGQRPHDKSQQGPTPVRRKLTDVEITAKEEKMLQQALRASTKDLRVPTAGDISQIKVKKETSQLRRNANRKKQEEVLRKKEAKMLQEALKASLS